MNKENMKWAPQTNNQRNNGLAHDPKSVHNPFKTTKL
jgi:hypothetical protein